MAIVPQYVEIVVPGVVTTSNTGTRPVVNVFHFQRANLVLPYSKSAIADAFRTSIMANLIPLLQQDWTAPGVDVRFIEDATDPYTRVVHAYAGVVATERGNLTDCVTLRLNALARGRSNHGRKYFGPIAQAAIVKDEIASTPWAAWQTFATTLAAGFTDSDTNDWLPVVVSRKNSQLAANPTTVVSAQVFEVIANRTLGNLARRKERPTIHS